MRILFIDIDTLRPDHLGCYGYSRDTSPNLDRLAAEGTVFESCHVSDAPCLPSRASLWTGRFGYRNGAVGHGGTVADPFSGGPGRGFRSELAGTSWMSLLRNRGMRTASVSPFAERHSAFWFHAGFNETINTGKGGMETADEISAPALDWLRRNGKSDNWFLHVNFWDPHTPYRTPASFGNPFAGKPLPGWLTAEVLASHWEGYGPHSAREARGFGPWDEPYAAPAQEMKTLDDVRGMFDGYDTGIRFADEHVGRILDALAGLGILGETAILVSSDHGENLGELNIYGDHQTADLITSHVPAIVRWPGVAPRRDRVLHYQNDIAATVVELAGGNVPECWDGRGFAGALKRGVEEGRDHLVLSQMAWSCQRAVLSPGSIYIKSYHDGYHGFPEEMLFDAVADPHEIRDLSGQGGERFVRGRELLAKWEAGMHSASPHPDPVRTVLAEGGPFHCRGELPKYLKRLRATGRSRWAELLESGHPGEAKGS